MTINDFVLKYDLKIKFTVKRIVKRPDGLMLDHSRHFKCIVSFEGRSMIVYFSQGSAHTKDPTLNDILNCLVMDCQGFCADGFESWASDMGYDTDSIKALKIYKAILKEKTNFYRVFGPAVANELLDCETD